MNKKFIALILTLIFAIIICGNSSATDWTVGPGGKYNYTTIQSAVNGANSDDTITVYDDGGNPYTYQENVVINKNNLTVTGNGQVIVRGSSNPSNPVFTVNSGSSLATIGGFNITGATNSAGVYIEGTSGVTLRNLNISECGYGVEVSGSHVLLDNVSVSNVSSVGVYLIGDVSDLTIQNCYINDSGTPIYKDRSKNVDGLTIKDSVIFNAHGDAINLVDYVNQPSTLKNILIDNVTINGATGSGLNIRATVTGSENLTIRNNTVTNCSQNGIYIYAKSPVTLNNNTISGNGTGLYLQSVSGGNFQDNKLINNTGDDLYAADDTSNIFTRLTVGLNHPTMITFDYINGIIVNGLENAPADPNNKINIGKYLDISGLGSTSCNLKVYYTSSDLGLVNPLTLKLWKYNGNWSEVPGTNGVNTTEKYVYADNIGSFSVFIPLGSDVNPPTVAADKHSGTYKGPLEVTLTTTDDFDPTPVIHYLLGGSWYTQASSVMLYINTEGFNSIEFYAVDAAGNESLHQTKTYTIDNTAPSVNADKNTGNYKGPLNVTLSASDAVDPVPVIYYRINSGSWNSQITTVVLPFNTEGTQVLEFYAVDAAGNESLHQTKTYTIDNTAPTASASPVGGYYNTSKSVIFSAKDNLGIKPTIYYTLNGSTPTTSSAKYSSPISINSTKTLKFIAVDSVGNQSSVYTQKYTIFKVSSTSPVINKTGVSRLAMIYVKFSENIKIYSTFYYNKITVKNLSTGKTTNITKSIKGNTLSIKNTTIKSAYTWYQVTIPAKAVKDYAEKYLAANYTFKFKTGSK